MSQPLNVRRVLAGLFGASLLALLWSCSIPVTPATTITGYVFQITATSAYSGELVSDSSNTPVSGSGNQSIKITTTSGQQYTLSLTKSSNDGTTLGIQLIADETVDGTPTTVVVETDTTTDTSVPARAVLLE